MAAYTFTRLYRGMRTHARTKACVRMHVGESTKACVRMNVGERHLMGTNMFGGRHMQPALPRSHSSQHTEFAEHLSGHVRQG